MSVRARSAMTRLRGLIFKDYVFDWDKVLNFDGETGPYVQYTYARASSVIRRAGQITGTVRYSLLSEDASLDLVKEISRYPDVVLEAADKYEPFLISRYAMDVAHAFNKFYQECKINVDDEDLKASRISLVEVTRWILKDALSLLGIHCPEQM